MQYVLVHLAQRAVFHNLTGVDDGYAVAVLGHYAQIMGDEQHGRVALALEGVYHLQHLGLNGHVQGGGRLVGNEEPGFAGQGDGDHHPLLHAARELVGVVAVAGGGDAHHLHHVLGVLFRVLAGHLRVVGHDHLPNLVPYGHNRVEAGHGVLEDHGDLAAPVLAHLLRRQTQQVRPIEEDLAGDNLSRRVGDQTHNAAGQGGLACAGLPHQTQGFPLAQGDVRMGQGLDHAVLRGVDDA